MNTMFRGGFLEKLGEDLSGWRWEGCSFYIEIN